MKRKSSSKGSFYFLVKAHCQTNCVLRLEWQSYRFGNWKKENEMMIEQRMQIKVIVEVSAK